METKIYLINAEYHIDLMKEDENIKDMVIKDFKMFTRGTAKDYRCADKLLYIDNIRNRLHFTDFDDYVDDYIQDTINYQRDVGIMGEDDKFEVSFDYEFAENVFNNSKRNFYKSGEKLILYKNLVKIIKAVMEYED